MKKLIILIFSIYFFSSVHSQSVYPSFENPDKTANIPINFQSGAPNINIPIWNVSGNDINLPINLKYRSNGIKVNQESGSYGLGWQIDMGVSLSQSVYGLNNLDYDYVIDEILNPTSGFLVDVSEGIIDSKPDIFTFSNGRESVNFCVFREVITEPYQIIKLTESNIYIEFLPDIGGQGCHGFKIIDESGKIYLFERISPTISYIFDDSGNNIDKVNISREFHLTKIVNSNKTDSILINYFPEISDRDDIFVKCNNSYGKNFLYEDITGNKHYSHDLKGKSYISEIRSSNEVIHFSYSNYGHSEYNSPYDNIEFPEIPLYKDLMLNNISIDDENNRSIKDFAFHFIPGAINGTRIFLDQVTESYPLQGISNPYTFLYYDISSMKDMKSKNMDFWYYASNAINLAECSERFPDPEVAIKGILTEVHYPEGGYTKFEYEPNTYNFDNTAGWYNEDWDNVLFKYGFDVTDNLVGPGLRVKKIVEFNGINNFNVKEIVYSDNNISSGRLSYYPILEYKTDPWDGVAKSSSSVSIDMGFVSYKKITVYDGGQVQNGTGLNGKTQYFFVSDPPTENDINNLQFDIKLFNRETNSLMDKIIIYNNLNQVVQEKRFEYISEIDSVYLPGIETKKFLADHLWGRYRLYNEKNRLERNIIRKYDLNNQSSYNEEVISYVYERNNKYFSKPVESTSTNSKGETLKKEFFYPIDFEGDNGVYDEMISNNILSPVIKEETFINNQLISGFQNLYKLFTTGENKTIIVPSYYMELQGNIYKTINTFSNYSSKGNLVYSVGYDGVQKSFIYNNSETNIIAEILNAASNEVFYTSFEENGNYLVNSKTGKKSFNGSYTFKLPIIPGQYQLSYWKLNGNVWEYEVNSISNPGFGSNYTINEGIIDELRVHPADGLMNTFCYTPLVGKNTETDINNVSTFYEYDNFHRLIEISDDNKDLIQNYEYNIPELPEVSFNLISDVTTSFYSGCQNVNLSVSTNYIPQPDEQPIKWQWFDDHCGGNIIAEGNNSISYSPTSKNNTIFVRPIVNGYCLPCESHEFDVIDGTLTFTQNSPTYYEMMGQDGLNVQIPYSYNACDTEPVPEIVYRDVDWLNIYHTSNSYTFLCSSPTYPPEPNDFQFVKVKWGDKNLTFARVFELTAYIEYHYFFQEYPILFYFWLTCFPGGGNGIYSYRWFKNNQLIGNCQKQYIYPSAGDTYTCVCTSGNQTVTVTYSF